MFVYRVAFWYGGNPNTVTRFVGAETLQDALNSLNEDEAAVAIDMLGALIMADAEPVAPEVKQPTPAEIKASITPDFITSFEDGKLYRTLKRHVAKHGMTLAEYRTKWGLPSDYPSVAPGYSVKRSELAKAAGLGRK